MKREELLKYLKVFYIRYVTSMKPTKKDELAFQQIVALIKASFNLKNKSLGKLAEDLGISFSAAKIISDHAQPQVTEEWIEKWARKMCNAVDAEFAIYPKESKDFIRSIVEQIK